MYQTHTSETSPLRIAVVSAPAFSGQIGMTICPGKKDYGFSGIIWDRDLETDLDAISAWGATALVTLLEEAEFEMLKIRSLSDVAQAKGIEWFHFSIPDRDIPRADFEAAWEKNSPRLHQILCSGEKILIHCRGGLGRTGVVAARLLTEFGLEPSEAIDLVRSRRPGAIETIEQEQYVLSLAPRSVR